LRKASRSASIVKLQSLLDLALNTGEDTLYREDVKVMMAETGLYDFLLKVVNVQGIGGRSEEGGEDGHAHEEQKKEKDDKKSMLGEFYFTTEFLFERRF
jgi:gamma-tubulin complex component 2